MSNTTHDDKTDKPLPGPIGEDAIIQDSDEASDDADEDVADSGLADTGSGEPDTRKII